MHDFLTFICPITDMIAKQTQSSYPSYSTGFFFILIIDSFKKSSF